MARRPKIDECVSMCAVGRAATLLFFCLYVTVLFSHRQVSTLNPTPLTLEPNNPNP